MNVLANTQWVMEQGEAGRKRGQQQRLNHFAQQAYGADPMQRDAIVQQAIGTDADAGFALDKSLQADEDRRTKTLVNMSKMLTGTPEQYREPLYQKMRPSLQRLGLATVPDTYTPEVGQIAEQLVQAYGGVGANGVQSTYINRAGQRVAIMRDGSQQVLGDADARTQLRDHPGMTPEIVDLRAGTTQQLRTGGDLQSASGGREVPFSIDPSLPPEVQAAIRQIEATGQPVPDQITVAKPAAARPAMSAAEAERIQIARENAANARAAREDAAAARQAAEQAKADQKAQANAVRQAEAATAANQLINAIDTLTSAPGFAELGTAVGDLKLNTPLLRSDVKDAEAQLKNVAGQVALATMARLKALSSTGATGFGSLTAPELNLLQNSIATLQRENVSNAQLVQSLKTIRDTMEKVSAPQAATPDAPQRRATDQPQRVQTAADYDALPSGAQYVAPDGSVRRKK